ncbi:MAG: LamG domain-containing protein [Candidatus Moraniibacteriota bacterium]|nr:MAG: LamG domain-containing protein [Candidatus Moranbacteria bacterium]
MRFFRGKSSRGSVLAYTLIVLAIVLAASIGMMASSVTDLQSISSNTRSSSAFQIADSSAQLIRATIKNPSGVPSSADTIGEYWTNCRNRDGKASVTGEMLGGTYEVSFLGGEPEQDLECGDDVSAVTVIKSVGSYRDTARAVRVFVAARPTLVGHWKLDENSGTSASDDSGKNNNGALRGPGVSFSGDELLFNSTAGKGGAEVPHSDTLNMTRAVTISLWLFVDETPPGDWTPLVSKMAESGAVDTRTYSIWLNRTGYINLSTSDGVNHNFIDTREGSIELKRWYHYVGIIDRTNKRMVPYINGDLAVRPNNTDILFAQGNAVSNTASFRIGSIDSSSFPFSPFTGKIDDVRVYDGALSTGEVKKLFDAGRNG